jgi:hypothetical protein
MEISTHVAYNTSNILDAGEKNASSDLNAIEAPFVVAVAEGSRSNPLPKVDRKTVDSIWSFSRLTRERKDIIVPFQDGLFVQPIALQIILIASIYFQ